MAFLPNHRDAIAAMDFFVVLTVTFRALYVWFVIEHDRRRVRHYFCADPSIVERRGRLLHGADGVVAKDTPGRRAGPATSG